jgi:hypothetical protein
MQSILIYISSFYPLPIFHSASNFSNLSSSPLDAYSPPHSTSNYCLLGRFFSFVTSTYRRTGFTACRCLFNQLFGASALLCSMTLLLDRRLFKSYHAVTMALFSRFRISFSFSSFDFRAKVVSFVRNTATCSVYGAEYKLGG